METGTETPIFLFWEYLFQNFGTLSLQCDGRFGGEKMCIAPPKMGKALAVVYVISCGIKENLAKMRVTLLCGIFLSSWSRAKKAMTTMVARNPDKYIFYYSSRPYFNVFLKIDYCIYTYTLGGFNFILFWNFNRNQTEIDRYCQKNNFLLFAKCLKMYIFFAFAF